MSYERAPLAGLSVEQTDKKICFLLPITNPHLQGRLETIPDLRRGEDKEVQPDRLESKDMADTVPSFVDNNDDKKPTTNDEVNSRINERNRNI